jgi:hypothetical protein
MNCVRICQSELTQKNRWTASLFAELCYCVIEVGIRVASLLHSYYISLPFRHNNTINENRGTESLKIASVATDII